MKSVIMPVFVPHMGCSHQCVFCNQYKITGVHHMPKAEALEGQVRRWTDSCGQVPGLAFYGGSFTAIDISLQIPLLEAAKSLKARGLIHHIRLSTRPDALDEATLERLKDYSVDVIEIGIQSLDDEVLLRSGRGHSAQTAVEAVRRVKKWGFSCGAQLMVGLPGDTPERSLQTCEKIVQEKPDFARIYPTVVIKETPLAQLYERKQYEPWAFDVLIDTVAEMVEKLETAKVPVIRIGLQAEEHLESEDVLAGGYHPAMGEYVRGRMMRKRMQAMLSDHETGEITLAVHPKQVSQAIGQHRENILFLEERYHQKIRIIADDVLVLDQIERR